MFVAGLTFFFQFDLRILLCVENIPVFYMHIYAQEGITVMFLILNCKIKPEIQISKFHTEDTLIF